MLLSKYSKKKNYGQVIWNGFDSINREKIYKPASFRNENWRVLVRAAGLEPTVS